MIYGFRLLALLAFGTLAGAAAAQDGAGVPVQSGEHARFTRLAIFAGGAGDWRFGRTGGGYALELPGAPGFDIGRVFEMIPRDRIAGLAAAPGRLDIATECDCHAEVFPFGAGWLVVDIIDGPPAIGSAFETPLDPAAPAVPAGPAPGPDRPALDRGGLPLFATGGPATPAPPAPPRAATAAPAQDSLPRESPLSPHAGAADIRNAMAESLARAVGQGLLDLAQPLAPPPGSAAAPPPAPAAEPRPQLPQPPRPPGIPGIAAHTGVDRARTGGAVASPGGCPAADGFDLALWAGTGDFATETARGQAALTDARDRIDPAGVETLARIQIAFGFGREALATLALDPGRSRDRDRLALLARIVDGEPVPGEGFVAQAGCAGPDALWRALGLGSVAGMTEGEKAALSTAFLLLPDALRGQIGPRLATLFAEAGDPLAAQDFLDRAAGPDAASAGAGLAATQADVAAGRTGGALDRLETIADTDSRMGPGAMVALVDLAIAEGRLPDPADLSLLRALRYEYRGRAEEAALIRAEMRLLGATGDHAGAIALAAGLPATDRTEALGEAVTALALGAEDAAFLETAFAADLSDLPPAAANALAGRLIGLGFPAEAQAHLGAIAAGPDLAERRYLRAEAALLLGRADLVDAELLGLADTRAEALRARAGLTGDAIPDAAPDIPPPGATPPGAGTDPAATPVSPGAGSALSPPAALPPLAARGALIAEAEAVRQRARDLLENRVSP